MILLKTVVRKLDGGTWTCLMRLRIGTHVGLLWTRQWTFEFLKMRVILWLAEELLAFSEGLCCLELIGLWNWNRPTFTTARRLSVFRATRTASTPLRNIRLGPALLLTFLPASGSSKRSLLCVGRAEMLYALPTSSCVLHTPPISPSVWDWVKGTNHRALHLNFSSLSLRPQRRAQMFSRHFVLKHVTVCFDWCEAFTLYVD